MIKMNFLDWLAVYEYEKQMMEIVMVPKKRRSKSAPRKKKADMCSRSKVLKKIIECLETKQYQHMLYWINEMKKEFIIKFVHMNNPEWKNADYLELFKELDRLSSSYETYVQEEKYGQKCKIRCKSNLRKLVKSEALTLVGTTKKGKSIELRRYKLNLDVSSVKNAVLKDEKMATRCNVNGLNGRETVPLKTGITYIKGTLKIENLPNEQSHCLCLSNSNPIKIFVNIPLGGTIVSSATQVGPPLLDICCTAENTNEDSRNVRLQKELFAVYEHEKQMDENINALHAVSAEDLGMCSSSTSSSGIEEKDKSEMMECCQLLDQKSPGTVEIQNNGAIPTNYGESLNMESVEIIFPCTNPIEEAMRAINIASTDSTPSGYTELQYSSNSPNRVQNEDCQDMDEDVTNIQHLVPSSPQNWDGFNNDPSSPVWYYDSLDADKPLQQDNDPFLSELALDCLNDSLIDESGNLMADHEARPFMSSLILRI